MDGGHLSCFLSSCLLSRFALKVFFSHLPHHTNGTSSPSSGRESLDDDLTGERAESSTESGNSESIVIIDSDHLSKKEQASAMESLWVTSSRLAEQNSLFLHGLNYLCHCLKVLSTSFSY